MSTPAAFQATYSDWRLIKGRKVVQVVFELPLEAANEAYAALGGMPNPAAEVWCGIARLVQPARKEVGTEATMASSQLTPASVKPPARAPRNKLAQLAGMLGKDPLFHRYLESRGYENVTEEGTAEYIRDTCAVASRSQILANTLTGEKFIKLYDNFILWRETDAFVETT